MQRVRERLKLVVPITLFIVFLLLYFNTGSAVKTCIILLAVPFSAIGAVWFLYLLGYNMSIAVWVGLIALLGVDAETAVFMLLYLDLAYHEAQQEGADAQLGRSARSHRQRRGQTAPSQGYDRGLHAVRLAAHHVVGRRRRGRDEAHRRAHDRRNCHLVRDGVDCLSADLRHLEMELGAAAGAAEASRSSSWRR